jgi:hypothetical protein
MNCDIAQVLEEFRLEGTGQVLNGVLPWAIGLVLAERLWQLSEQITGVKFDR